MTWPGRKDEANAVKEAAQGGVTQRSHPSRRHWELQGRGRPGRASTLTPSRSIVQTANLQKPIHSMMTNKQGFGEASINIPRKDKSRVIGR